MSPAMLCFVDLLVDDTIKLIPSNPSDLDITAGLMTHSKAGCLH